MWKPGAPKPKDNRPMDNTNMQLSSSSLSPNTNQGRNNNNNNNTHLAAAADAGAIKRKNLSNATMGMRFMQRSKAHAEAAAAVLRQITPKVDDDVDHDVTMQDSTSTPLQQEQQQQESEQQHALAHTVSLPAPNQQQHQEEQQPSPADHPLVATASDMYGVKADMIGRRSFGGFHKGVEEAYQSSWQAWKTGQARVGGKDNMLALSDEELLRRYQELVSNRGGGISKEGYKMEEEDDYTKTCGKDKPQRQSWPIGNLKQQKRNGSSGQKRKR